MHDTIKKAVEEAIEKNELEGALNEDSEAVELLFKALESNSDIHFSVKEIDDGDRYMIVEYYSEKLGYTIILDHEFTPHYETVEEIVQDIIRINDEIANLQGKIYSIPTEETIDAIKSVVSYAIADEMDHWEEEEKPEDHIYHDFLKLQNYIKKI